MKDARAKRGNDQSLIDQQLEMEFHDVMLLKPEKLQALLITASILLIAFITFVGVGDWYFCQIIAALSRILFIIIYK